jgi:uncharacterized protein YegP (UPF0339 family)
MYTARSGRENWVESVKKNAWISKIYDLT